MSFKHHQILKYFENVRVSNSTKECYIFSDEIGNDFFEVYILSDHDYRFVIDNYPAQRKFYSTNLPYRDINDFESDMARIGIKLKRKNEKPT